MNVAVERILAELRSSPVEFAVMSDCRAASDAAGEPCEMFVLALRVRGDRRALLGALADRLTEAGIVVGVVSGTPEFRLEIEHQRGLSKKTLERVLGHVETHLEQRLSLSELSAVAGVSVSHFTTLFRRSLGVSVHRYVMQRRVERARSLLERDAPIAVVALETGFTDASHLARWMRRLLGVTPRQVSKRER
jgi:transcriptional regulator GlxA family with amidase domain